MVKASLGSMRGRIDSAKKKIKDLEARKSQIDREIEVLDRYIQACHFIETTERGGARRMAARKPGRPWKGRLRRARRAPARRPPGGGFKGMKIAEAAEILLKRSGVPIRVSEMVKRLRAGGINISSKVPGASVTAAMRRHPDKFRMTKPGFYAYVKK